MLRAERRQHRLTGWADSSAWRSGLAVLTALVALLSGYRPLLEGSRWWWLAALMTVAMLAACALVRVLGFGHAWLWVSALWLLSLVWAFAPDTLWIVLPTPSSAVALSDVWAGAHAVMLAEQAPVSAIGPVVFVVVAAFGLLAIAADALAIGLRRPHLLGVMLIVVYAVPAAVAGTGPDVLVFVVAAAAWLVLLRIHTQHGSGPSRRALTSPVVAVAGAALAVGIVLPPVLPAMADVHVSWGSASPGVFSRGINPIVELGHNLRRNTPVTALQYTTTASRPPYLKVYTLFKFTGDSWQPDRTHKYGRIEGNVGLGSSVDRSEVTTSIKVKNLDSQQLPVPYPALRVNGLEGDWRWEPDGLTLTTKDSNADGQSYSVKSLQIEPTRTQMEASVTTIDNSLRQYIRLPPRMPRSIAATARVVTAAASNDYDEALALQSYLRNGAFTYSETAPVDEGFDGNGADVIAEFLRVKAGYCVHFASAMAVMARTLDIPARIAVGYAPGTRVGTNDNNDNVYQVTSNDLHAWPELYFEGIGWVPFDPTPSVGNVTAFSDPLSGDDVRGAQGANGDGSGATRGLNDFSLVDPVNTAATQHGAQRGVVLAVAGGLVLLMLVPILMRTLQRARRMRRGRQSANALWVELECLARDFGVTVAATETPRTFAARLAVWPGMRADALAGLLAAVERERFARVAAATDNEQTLRDVVTSLRQGATRWQRLRARLLPRSIFGPASYYAPAARPQPAAEPG